MLDELIAKAKALIEEAETKLKGIAAADETQLRVAVQRLELFVEHLRQVIADPPTPAPAEDESGEDEDLDALSRADLNAHAVAVGVEAPDKLPNKGAVIDAIQAVSDPAAEDESGEDDEQ